MSDRLLNKMPGQALVSVIVPVYNIEAYLPQCWNSIVSQTYRNLEIILVDDGSTDGSGQMCDVYAADDTRCRVIHQPNQGLWAARNTGLDAAHGDYLLFPDGDDYFHRDTIRQMYEALQQHPQCDLAIVGRKRTERIDEDITSAFVPVVREEPQERLVAGLFEKEDRDGDRFYVYMWNKLYRRRLIDSLRCERYLRSQDFDFNFRAFIRADSAVVLDKDLYFWFQHPGSLIKQPDAVDIYYECRTRLSYTNYVNLPSDKKQYGRYLLQHLYKKMVFWKGRSFGKAEQDFVFGRCRAYERATRKDYLRCGQIRFSEKTLCLFLLHAPHITRWLMKITKNY